MKSLKSKPTILDLIKNRIVVLDGAMGSLLIDQGLPPGDPPDFWNISNPEKVQKIHKSYFDAGSDVVFTNTFGSSMLKMMAYKHGNSIEDYNKKAVELAIEICPEHGYIAGDLGPCGGFLPPVGTPTGEEFYNNSLEQAQYLSEAGVDFFVVETMVDIEEAEAAVRAIKEISKLPILASITYKKTKRGYFTIMGNSVEHCVKVLEEAGVDIIGANCTLGSDQMIDLVPVLRKETNLPISVKPNAGQPQLIDGKTIYNATPQDFARDILVMIEAGANVVGGCCGSNPEFIRKIAEKVMR
ncbi:MAG: homocysteine S-methyltransferase family protein [Candidatus Heimdallarchaeota archaeon]